MTDEEFEALERTIGTSAESKLNVGDAHAYLAELAKRKRGSYHDSDSAILMFLATNVAIHWIGYAQQWALAERARKSLPAKTLEPAPDAEPEPEVLTWDPEVLL